MAALSLKLPDDLALESKAVAEKIGITRTEFIRQALRHELEEVKAQIEREDIAKALIAMRDDPDYLAESESLQARLKDTLPEETTNW